MKAQICAFGIILKWISFYECDINFIPPHTIISYLDHNSTTVEKQDKYNIKKKILQYM